MQLENSKISFSTREVPLPSYGFYETKEYSRVWRLDLTGDGQFRVTLFCYDIAAEKLSVSVQIFGFVRITGETATMLLADGLGTEDATIFDQWTGQFLAALELSIVNSEDEQIGPT